MFCMGACWPHRTSRVNLCIICASLTNAQICESVMKANWIRLGKWVIYAHQGSFKKYVTDLRGPEGWPKRGQSMNKGGESLT